MNKIQGQKLVEEGKFLPLLIVVIASVLIGGFMELLFYTSSALPIFLFPLFYAFISTRFLGRIGFISLGIAFATYFAIILT